MSALGKIMLAPNEEGHWFGEYASGCCPMDGDGRVHHATGSGKTPQEALQSLLADAGRQAIERGNAT